MSQRANRPTRLILNLGKAKTFSYPKYQQFGQSYTRRFSASASRPEFLQQTGFWRLIFNVLRAFGLSSCYNTQRASSSLKNLATGLQEGFKLDVLKMTSITYASSVELQDRSRQIPPPPPQTSTQPEPFHSDHNEAPHDAEVIQQHLEPVDGGAAAWKLLGAAFIFEALFWGISFHIQRQLHDITTNTEFSRVPSLLWNFSELLLPSSTICRQSVHSYCGHCSIWDILPWSTAGHSVYKKIFEISKTNDMGWL